MRTLSSEVIDHGLIKSVEPVVFDRRACARAHAIGERLISVYDPYTGMSMYMQNSMRPGYLERLLASLPE